MNGANRVQEGGGGAEDVRAAQVLSEAELQALIDCARSLHMEPLVVTFGAVPAPQRRIDKKGKSIANTKSTSANRKHKINSNL